MSQRELTRGRLRRMQPWMIVYAGTVVVVALVAGILWNRLVMLPAYVISDEYRAVISEAGLNEIVATDVYYALIGAVAGLIVGMVAWLLFRRLGWVVAVIAAGGAAIAGLITRQVGEVIGPKDFAQRIAAATRADRVTVDFTAHTWVTLAVWVGMAAVPVLIGSFVRHEEWINHVPQAAPLPDRDDSDLG